MIAKYIIMMLLLLNAASGIWTAQILYSNNDKLKAIFSISFAFSCLVIFGYVLMLGSYHKYPIILLFVSSLLLFTIDRVRGKNESLKYKSNKNVQTK